MSMWSYLNDSYYDRCAAQLEDAYHREEDEYFAQLEASEDDDEED